MARTWLSIRVELLGGRGEDLWPYPGRVLVVGPSHTFADLARAIDDAFARWDRAHLHQFTLSDGTLVADEETAEEALAVPVGPIPTTPLVLEQTKVTRRVAPGDEFRYVFDLGDNWTHACTVEKAKVDPVEALGVVPDAPTPVWGWGTIPDQYGRRWNGDTSDDDPIPRRPVAPHPMRRGRWPAAGPGEPVDLQELRGATYRRDVPAILAALEGREVDDLLQYVGIGLQVVLAADRTAAESLAVSVVNRLERRGSVGDDVLAEDLIAELRGEPPAGRQLPVDLLELAAELSGDPAFPPGCLDLRTGEVLPGALLDPVYVGEEDAVDLEEEPDRWLPLDWPDSRAAWQDMAEFAARQTNADLRRRLESAIEGRGAFRRFRDAVDEVGLVESWHRFSDDRQVGRARAYLAAEGIRALPPR